MLNSKDNSLIGFQDLLFCGAGASLLLFLIFAIKIGGNSVASSDIDIDAASTLVSFYSIPDDITENLNGGMKSVRTVQISGIQGDTYQYLQERINNQGLPVWNLYGYSADEIEQSTKQYIHFLPNQIQFYLVLDSLASNQIQFTLNGQVFGEIQVLNKNVGIRAQVIEGYSSVFSSDDELNKKYNGQIAVSESEINIGNINISFLIRRSKEPTDIIQIQKRTR